MNTLPKRPHSRSPEGSRRVRQRTTTNSHRSESPEEGEVEDGAIIEPETDFAKLGLEEERTENAVDVMDSTNATNSTHSVNGEKSQSHGSGTGLGSGSVPPKPKVAFPFKSRISQVKALPKADLVNGAPPKRRSPSPRANPNSNTGNNNTERQSKGDFYRPQRQSGQGGYDGPGHSNHEQRHGHGHRYDHSNNQGYGHPQRMGRDVYMPGRDSERGPDLEWDSWVAPKYKAPEINGGRGRQPDTFGEPSITASHDPDVTSQGEMSHTPGGLISPPKGIHSLPQRPPSPPQGSRNEDSGPQRPPSPPRDAPTGPTTPPGSPPPPSTEPPPLPDADPRLGPGPNRPNQSYPPAPLPMRPVHALPARPAFNVVPGVNDNMPPGPRPPQPLQPPPPHPHFAQPPPPPPGVYPLQPHPFPPPYLQPPPPPQEHQLHPPPPVPNAYPSRPPSPPKQSIPGSVAPAARPTGASSSKSSHKVAKVWSKEEEKAAYGREFMGSGRISEYTLIRKLGEGTFGEVHQARCRTSPRLASMDLALKRIIMHNAKDGMPITALREIKILKALNHHNIVKVLDVVVMPRTPTEAGSVYMVFPYMDHDLAGLLENPTVKLNQSHVKLYMKQLLEGLEYMHENHIIHRDIKAANILISNEGVLQIADFGLARTYITNTKQEKKERGLEKYTNCVVTRWYRPPELLMGERYYGGEIDLWGVGCILAEMFVRRPIFQGTSDMDQLEKIFWLCGTPTSETWPDFENLPGLDGVKTFKHRQKGLRDFLGRYDSITKDAADLIDALLSLDPIKRPTATDALVHEYFWTSPMPADPKTMPKFESSHELDQRRKAPPPPPPNQHQQQYRGNQGGGGGRGGFHGRQHGGRGGGPNYQGNRNNPGQRMPAAPVHGPPIHLSGDGPPPMLSYPSHLPRPPHLPPPPHANQTSNNANVPNGPNGQSNTPAGPPPLPEPRGFRPPRHHGGGGGGRGGDRGPPPNESVTLHYG